MCVTVCRKNLNDAISNFNNGYIKCTAAKVIY